MSQILSAVRRTARGKEAATYEDLDESSMQSGDFGSHIPEEIEMASVSVIPDGRFTSVGKQRGGKSIIPLNEKSNL